MADTYATKGLPPPPAVSKKTLPMAGLLVDVYGLGEIPSNKPLTCLWLLHPRTRTRARMRDIASRTIAAWNAHAGEAPERGLIALAFDMPNHGTRLISKSANLAWDGGNASHAIDMMGMVKGGVTDMAGLMDLVAGYLGREVDGHVCLGWSLGGHSLMSDRAAIAKLDCGDNFIGSKYFPDDLVKTCLSYDPRALLFGTSPVQPDQARLKPILDARVRGKRLLLCSGGDDVLVPYANSRPLATLLKEAAGERGWYDGSVVVEDRVYEGVGHRFNAAMVEDAVRFLVDAVERGPRGRGKIRDGEKSVL
ncbi:hypothetical protein ACHAPT_004811 [Fusarium lateritium]